MPPTMRKIGFGLAALVAVAGVLALMLYASFPYFYAESGSARYAREHRGEALLALFGALALSWVAWQCIRRSFPLRWWGVLVAALIVTGVIRSRIEDRKAPEGARAVGGNWHVVTTDEPREYWKVRHRLFYKDGSRYVPIEDVAAEYRFVPPDCVTYRAITVDTRYAMCGFRSPVSDDADPSMTDADLVEWAATRPPYRYDWRSIPD